MPTIKTHEICAEGLTAHLVKIIARAFGVDEQTVRAWRHPKESDLNPTGTGKRNPLDQVERYVRIIHQSNPGNARAVAAYFVDLVNELDRESGVDSEAATFPGTDAILPALLNLMRESADVPQALIGKEFDEHTLRRVRKEVREERAALEALDGAVELKLRQLEKTA